jgi:hypothetical protein
MQSVLSYNETGVKRGGSKDDIRQGYNVWVGLVDPTDSELWSVPAGLIIVLLTMAAISAVLIICFRKKQWLLVGHSDLREKNPVLKANATKCKVNIQIASERCHEDRNSRRHRRNG